jgi:hypothetical protein
VGDRAFVAAQAADLAAMAELGARLAAGELDEDEAIRRAPFPEGTARTALGRGVLEARGEDQRWGPARRT